MKSKQLANVLIKILGLSVSVHALPSIFNGLLSLTRSSRGIGLPDMFWSYTLPSVVMLAIGVYLILRSRNVAGCLFKDKED